MGQIGSFKVLFHQVEQIHLINLIHVTELMTLSNE